PGQLRLFAEEQPERRQRDHPVPAEDPGTGRAGPGGIAGLRDPARGLPGCEALYDRRLRADLGFVPRLRDPDVLRRADADRVVLPEAPPLPVPGAAGVHGGPDTVAAESAGLAGVLFRVRRVRAVEPLHALVGDGQPGPGLRKDGTGQGRQRAEGALGARVP